MKVEKSYLSLMEAWQIAANALHVVSSTLLDNADVSREVRDAHFLLSKEVCRWYDEIQTLKP